ncbi:MAG: multicopper oxidase domain-containing protein, partial [Methanobacteriota archaeon]
MTALLALGTTVTTPLGAGSAGYGDGPASSSALGPCPPDAPDRVFGVVALPVPVSYNHWGDMDLHGRLFVLDGDVVPLLSDVGDKLSRAGLGDLAGPVLGMRDAFAGGDLGTAVAEAAALSEAAAAALAAPEATAPKGRVDVSELAAPLVMRAHVGDCVTVRLVNVLPEAVGLHVHSVVSSPRDDGQAGFVPTGSARVYSFYVPPWPGMEGGHYLHSHADPRFQTRHGLFGVLAAEPAGSAWLSEKDGTTPAHGGLHAIIDMPGDEPDFREFVQIYHDSIELTTWQLRAMDVVSPYGEYGPGTKGINLRSEPFFTRFDHQDSLNLEGAAARGHDKSQAYGSYTNGDPGVDIPTSYVGDPVKFRFANAGPGQHHIHHLHGGGIRWRMTPLAEPSQFAAGFLKTNPVPTSASQRLDVQNVGPGESFNLEPEGGSGGVQQSAGDFLFHCHIVEHYVAGMWSFWRTLNTLKAGLVPLPDRGGAVASAVNTVGLPGTVLPDSTVITSANIDAWVRSQLPPPGRPGPEDASVWDWDVVATPQGPLYRGEPETGEVWPNYPADAPGRLAAGERPEILFDPLTGRLAYPLLRPHLGERPPFAPEHGPAPYLTPTVTEQAPKGLCPAESRVLRYNLVAQPVTIPYNAFDVDTDGMVFVRAEDRAENTAPGAAPTSIVLRANAGDCVDVTLSSALHEKAAGDLVRGIHTKTNIHIHLVQFDVQASDGVVAGFNYETTVRSIDGSDRAKDAGDPSAPVGTKLRVPATPGATAITVRDVRAFCDAANQPKAGSLLGIGLGEPAFETAKLVGLTRLNAAGNPVSPTCPSAPTSAVRGVVTLDRPLASAHAGSFFGAAEAVGYEFVNYRWYPDVELGTVYFHDHVDGLKTWRHGLFGSLVVEPAASRWVSPTRADPDPPMASPSAVAASPEAVAHVVDVLPGGGRAAFRELVLHFQDRACVDESRCLDLGFPTMPDREAEPAAFNLRSEPLHRRDPAAPLS